MSLCVALAQHIRRVDAGNQLSPYQLAAEIAGYLRQRGAVDEAAESAVETYVERANAGTGYLHPKPLTGAALADAIVDHFHLEG